MNYHDEAAFCTISECSKWASAAMNFDLKNSKREKMDMSCIPGKIIGHYSVADGPGPALSGIRVNNFGGTNAHGEEARSSATLTWHRSFTAVQTSLPGLVCSV
jgi:hypothetical protein